MSEKEIGGRFKPSVNLQKMLYLNTYFYPCWLLTIATMLYHKFEYLGRLNKFLSIAVLLSSVIVEPARLFCGYSGNLSNKVPEMAGFLMLTVLMQMPLVNYFLFNIHLESTPTELTLNIIFCLMMIWQIYFGYFSLKRTSDYARELYLARNSAKQNRY